MIRVLHGSPRVRAVLHCVGFFDCLNPWHCGCLPMMALVVTIDHAFRILRDLYDTFIFQVELCRSLMPGHLHEQTLVERYRLVQIVY